MWKQLIAILPLLTKTLTTEAAKKAADALLDVIEEEVKKSKNKYDDMIVLPLIKVARKMGDIPDYE